MKPSAYLDAVKAQLNITSDYELSKRFGIGNGRIVEMRTGSRPVPLNIAFMIAITLQLDPAEVVADLEEQREKNPKRRDFWRSFLSRAALVLLVAACTLGLNFSATYEAAAARLGGSKNRRYNFA